MINWVCSDFFTLKQDGEEVLVARLSPGTDEAVIYTNDPVTTIGVEQLGQLAEALTKLYEERE